MMNTLIQRATSGKTTRAQLWSNPIWTFKLTWEILKGANATPSDFQALVDFFLSRGGSFDTFLYIDPTDNAVNNQNFGTGDGVTLTFQLIRKWANFGEAIQNINGTPTIKDNGVTKTPGVDYSIDSFGVVSWAVAPISGHALTWIGNFYYRLRFKNDLQEFEQFMNQLWAAKTVELVSERL
jgi:uncharacterized protein (TIGR02217 family)